MKSLLPLLILCALPLAAQEPVIATLQITVDFIETTPAIATEILHGEKLPTSSLEWHDTLKRLLKDGESKLAATLNVTTKSGQRATAESVKERIYATEYNVPVGRAKHAPAVPAGLSGVDVPIPTAFEMRPVGARFEVDPVLGPDGKSIDLNIAPEFVIDLGNEPQLSLPTDGVERELIVMPKFYTMKVQTATAVTDGGSSLLGVLLPPAGNEGPDGEKRVLCFVTARIVKG